MEVWRPIEEYEGRYEVSSCGRVRSLARVSSHGHAYPQRIMRQAWHTNSYWVVWLRRPKEHRKYYVHVLVARAFLPNPDNRPVVNHIDGDRSNANVSNLEWCTQSENTRHYYRFLKPAKMPQAIHPEESYDFSNDIADIFP